MTPSVHTAARAIRRGRCVSRRKLELLLYYAQAWSLAWAGRPLFRARILAAADGPRIPELRRRRRRRAAR